VIWLYTLQYITLSFLMDFVVVIFSASCVYPNNLCIIRCFKSESALGLIDTHVNFRNSGHWRVLAST